MAKRKNPDEEKEGINPLLIVAVVAVLGIVGYFLFKKPKGLTPEELRQAELARQQLQQQPIGTGVGAQLAQVFGPVAQAAAAMYGSHSQAQIQMAQLKAQQRV